MPDALVNEQELQANEKQRNTMKDEIVYDESLFLDKIKGFTKRNESELPEIDEQAEEQEFDITHVVPTS